MIERSILAPSHLPRHVAIIMDGNRRWARAHALPALEGHRRGVGSLRTVVASALEHGIEVLSVFAFSEENWQRSAPEVSGILQLAGEFARSEASLLRSRNVRVRIVGRADRLPAATRSALERLERGTRACTGLLLNIAIDYSARREIVDAVRRLATAVRSGDLAPEAIDGDRIAGELTTAGLPDPDLLIRTGGELRLSNFLLYQCAYTELWATDRAWPEFGAADFRAAIDDFAKRQRRYGR